MGLTPQCIESLKEYRIIQISAGGSFSAAISENGLLFTWGQNINGQCGAGKNKKKVKIPNIVKLNGKASNIQCGDEHACLILKDASIYSFGYGHHGCLGHGSSEIIGGYNQKIVTNANEFVPKLIKALESKQIICCAAGQWHSLCIDIDGIVYSFGSTYDGQCGRSAHNHSIPVQIKFFVDNDIKARECIAGSRHSGIISKDNELYLFGKQLRSISKLQLSENGIIEKVAMGNDYTAVIVSNHS